jgi:hypothetical protein
MRYNRRIRKELVRMGYPENCDRMPLNEMSTKLFHYLLELWTRNKARVGSERP